MNVSPSLRSRSHVSHTQVFPRFPKALKKPPGRLRKATAQDAAAVALLYTSFLDEMHNRAPGGCKGTP
jgi:hypothetical protein